MFQDRLVKEMRLRNIRSMEQANLFLEGIFLQDMNRRYAVKARKEQDLHRTPQAGRVLEEILCVQERRVVGQDWCVRWRNRWLQIDREHEALNLPRRAVLIKHRADGQIIVEHKGQRLTWRELGTKLAEAKKKKVIVNNRSWKPAASHPWGCASARRVVPPVSLASAAPARDLQAEKRKKAG